MEKGRLEHRLSYATYLALLSGVFLGSIVYLILYHNQLIFFENDLEAYQISGVLGLPERRLLFYILRRRIGQILLYILLTVIFSYPAATALLCFVFGTYYGVAVSSFLLKFGMKAAGYLNFCFFPHYIFYFLALYLLGKWFYVQKNGYYGGYKNVYSFPNYVKLFVIFMFLVFAVLWEVYFQKNILNFFYQYIVQ